MVPDYTLQIEETFSNGLAVVMFGIARGTWTADGALKRENRWETPVAVRASLFDGGVAGWRVCDNNEPIRNFMSAHH
jgi:hypothetical protein